MPHAVNYRFGLAPMKSLLTIAWMLGLVIVAGCEDPKPSQYHLEQYIPETGQAPKPKPASTPTPTAVKASRLAFVGESNWKQRVLQAREPVVVDFWAEWCPHCRAMGPIMESLAKDYKAYRVDVDSNAELASQLRVATIPRLFIFHNGKVVYEHVGIPAEATVRAELQKLSRR
jgi:thioredoxin 1